MANLRSQRHLRTNYQDLVMVAVMGQVANPVAPMNAYRIGHDGIPRVLPGPGGIVINQRIGDRCVGLMGDHIEPGVALHNNSREVIGGRRGPNLALLTYACIGNAARVISGPCNGQTGLVTGKHGGVDHVLVDFPTPVLLQLQIGDRIQIHSCGLGLRLLDYPEITLSNCSRALLQRMGAIESEGRLIVPVCHTLPANVMGSGLGKNTPWRGDVDIQLFDPAIRRRYALDSLRFGDLIAIRDEDTRFGPAYRHGRVSIGIVVHGDSTVSGHGPGMTMLMSGPSQILKPLRDPRANLAALFKVREPMAPQRYPPLTGQSSWRMPQRSPSTALHHTTGDVP